MKKTFALLLCGLLIALLVATANPFKTALAQSPTPSAPALIQVEDTPENRITLDQINPEQDLLLLGPYDSRTLTFSLPPDWQPVSEGAALLLDLSWTVSSLVPAQGESYVEGLIAGALELRLNDVTLQTTILMGSSNQKLTIPLPDGALDTGANRLEFIWSSSTACDFNLSSSLMISGASQLIVPHEEISLSPKLAAFPAPFYQIGNIRPIDTTIVVANSASQTELQAALTVAAGLGRQSVGGMSLNLTAEDQLTETMRDENHLILVGRWGNLALMDNLELEVSENQAGTQGIVQVSTSPWNPGRAVLLVSGTNDEAINKAALAVSRGVLLTSSPSGALALVSEATSIDHSEDVPEKRTLADLGQKDLIFDTPGGSSKSIFFNIPPETAAGTQSFLELRFSHSQLLDYLRSSIIVRLNNTPIGSLRMSDTTAAFSSAQMVIPPAALQPGSNQIEIQVDLTPRSICSDPRRANTWVTIYPDSLLYLPYTNGAAINKTTASISNYPFPYTYSNTLAKTLFVLGDADHAGWPAAAQVAFDLGARTTNGQFSAPVAALGSVDLTQFAGYDLLLIGTPDHLEVLFTLGETLPVAFDTGNRPVNGATLSIQFDTSGGASTGYLQTGKTTDGNTVLAILGETQSGLTDAVEALTGNLDTFKGSNFAIVQNGAVLVEMIGSPARPATGETTAPLTTEDPNETDSGGQPVTQAGPAEETLPSTAQRHSWIVPSLSAAAALIVLILGWRIWLALLSRRR